MRTVQRWAWAGLPAVLVLLAGLAVTVGLDGTGWATGVGSGVLGTVALAAALRHHATTRLGPADAVTLSRAVLVCAVAGLVGDGATATTELTVLVALSSAALALDWLDGRVARRTGTVSALGAALDMEVDAYLILVLSVLVASTVGPWVLLIGAARYVLLVLAPLTPWLARPMPVRRWAKVVAAAQGIALVTVASDVLPRTVAVVVLAMALAALAASFGHQVWWLRCHRGPRTHPAPAATRHRSQTLQVTR